jgi:hypothetical protein
MVERWVAKEGRWVPKEGRWVAKEGRWVPKEGRWVAKEGRWVAKEGVRVEANFNVRSLNENEEKNVIKEMDWSFHKNSTRLSPWRTDEVDPILAKSALMATCPSNVSYTFFSLYHLQKLCLY